MSKPQIQCLLLAAGASKRFGGRKQLALINGKTMIQNQIETLEKISAQNIHIVLGAYAQEIVPHISSTSKFHIVKDWELGLGHSISSGVREILEKDQPDGILITLCDQIDLRVEDYDLLIRHFDKNRITCCDYGQKNGVPALFPKKFYAEISELSGDKGAQKLLNNNPNNVQSIFLPKAYRDIDTPSDLAEINMR